MDYNGPPFFSQPQAEFVTRPIVERGSDATMSAVKVIFVVVPIEYSISKELLPQN